MEYASKKIKKKDLLEKIYMLERAIENLQEEISFLKQDFESQNFKKREYLYIPPSCSNSLDTTEDKCSQCGMDTKSGHVCMSTNCPYMIKVTC